MELTLRPTAGGLAVAALLALFVPARAHAATPPAATAASCRAPQGPDHAFYPVVMQRTAVDVSEDPLKVWSSAELWAPISRKTTIWQGVSPVCGGQIIISQIVNRQCSSATACPARVVFRDGASERVLLDYKQVCTLHQDFELRGDSGELRACDEAVTLRPAQPN